MLQTGVVATYVQELISRRKRSKLGGASLLSSYGTPQGKKGSLLLTYLLTYFEILHEMNRRKRLVHYQSWLYAMSQKKTDLLKHADWLNLHVLRFIIVYLLKSQILNVYTARYSCYFSFTFYHKVNRCIHSCN